MRGDGDGGGARVTLIGKPGCHLCEDARAVVAEVAEQTGVGWAELSILEDPVLFDRYQEQIPVVLVDGVVHDVYRVDAARLRRALTGPGAGLLAAPGAALRRWWRGRSG